LIALIVTELFGPVPDDGEALRLKALLAKSILQEPPAGAVTLTVPLPEPYPVMLIVVPEIA
jgi:hypothetical protein